MLILFVFKIRKNNIFLSHNRSNKRKKDTCTTYNWTVWLPLQTSICSGSNNLMNKSTRSPQTHFLQNNNSMFYHIKLNIYILLCSIRINRNKRDGRKRKEKRINLFSLAFMTSSLLLLRIFFLVFLIHIRTLSLSQNICWRGFVFFEKRILNLFPLLYNSHQNRKCYHTFEGFYHYLTLTIC